MTTTDMIRELAHAVEQLANGGSRAPRRLANKILTALENQSKESNLTRSGSRPENWTGEMGGPGKPVTAGQSGSQDQIEEPVTAGPGPQSSEHDNEAGSSSSAVLSAEHVRNLRPATGSNTYGLSANDARDLCISHEELRRQVEEWKANAKRWGEMHDKAVADRNKAQDALDFEERRCNQYHADQCDLEAQLAEATSLLSELEVDRFGNAVPAISDFLDRTDPQRDGGK
jgi:hypothetical protein